jgi:CRISPR-associated endonuclease/helicase Cas3
MKIKTLPVFSKLADESEVRALGLWEKLPQNPDGSRWQLSQHQVETYKALTQGDAEVIFNTAMTGDGKSLAGQLPVLLRGINWKTLTMYPTNELIDDQYASFEKSKACWRAEVVFDSLNGAKLDQKMEEDEYSRRGDALMSIFKNHDLILTNPDIFHYVMHQFYNLPKDAPDGYAGQLTQFASQLVFDEFHIFDAPQIVSVLNALLFMREVGGETRKHKFLFLSATPGDLMSKYLLNSGLKVHEIHGKYATDGDPQHWRRILYPTEINIEPELRAETWVDAHLDDILLPFFKERTPQAKGAIIVNSVAAAYRLRDKIKPAFEKCGLRVELNTGLTGRSARKDSYSADLLIGTSTVDVGVDFQINFLVFESLNAGTFLQRLGRLGRHGGYERDGKAYQFQDYVAYALVPAWIEARLSTKSEENPNPLVDGSNIDRRELNAAIQKAYPPTTDFQHYARTWGQMQTIRILQGLRNKTIREQYQETCERLEERYKTTFQIKDLHYSRYVRLFKEKPTLLQEALTFRGGETFPCCLIDNEEKKEWERFKNTDLLRMIANYNLQPLSKDEFYAAVTKAGLKTRAFEEREPLGFFKKGSVAAERQNFKFFLNQNLIGKGENEFCVADVWTGFELDADFPGVAMVNKRLKQKQLVALLFEGDDPLHLKKRFGLPMLFPLYAFYSRDHRPGTVAFGRTALMLEARLKFLSVKAGGGAIIAD